MKTIKKMALLIIPLFYLSSCYVRVDDAHRHRHHHHEDHHEVIIEKR